MWLLGRIRLCGRGIRRCCGTVAAACVEPDGVDGECGARIRRQFLLAGTETYGRRAGLCDDRLASAQCPGRRLDLHADHLARHRDSHTAVAANGDRVCIVERRCLRGGFDLHLGNPGRCDTGESQAVDVDEVSSCEHCERNMVSECGVQVDDAVASDGVFLRAGPEVDRHARRRRRVVVRHHEAQAVDALRRGQRYVEAGA
ncbi:hypothetical protein GOSPT_086_00560 [Gordonia sputi NBRC 100414]|uniref:Uncharacterized protein n=1 Tax=Gordonia sputi NBRC 100414 TaxID=1089453 RepID=H5U2U9_9ACTN|nr:hypothetical protein GOSPT_086_00560 [Gordonia sputi NBRC 100414]